MTNPNLGNIVNSRPDTSTKEYAQEFLELFECNLGVFMPMIGLNAKLALDINNLGEEPGLAQRASLKTANMVAPLGTDVLKVFPSTLIKIYEANYYKEALGSNNQQPKSVLITGSGERLPELYSLMDYPLDPGLIEERADILIEKSSDTSFIFKENGVAPFFGKFPDKVHLAEPNSFFSSEYISNQYNKYLPEHNNAQLGKLNDSLDSQILFTDDSHRSLIDSYGKKSFDQVQLIRLDPNSLIPEGKFHINGDNSIVFNSYYAIHTLVDLLRLVKPGGNAIFSIGTGNNSEERITRYALLKGLEKLLNTFKVETTSIRNPAAELMFPNGVKNDSELEMLKNMNSIASISTLIIPYSPRIESVKDELRDPGHLGCGTNRFLRSFESAQKEAISGWKVGDVF